MPRLRLRLVVLRGDSTLLLHRDQRRFFIGTPTVELVVDADDNVWVRCETRTGATAQPRDEFGADCAHRGVVTRPVHQRIAAIPRTFVFVYRTDDDALQWLAAYARSRRRCLHRVRQTREVEVRRTQRRHDAP